MAQRLTGSVFGAVTVAAAGLLGRRAAGERAGLIAAGVACIYPILVTADGALMSESLYGMLIALALLAAWRLGEQPTPRRGITFGALIGLAALTRGEALVLLVLLLVPLARRAGGWRPALAALAAAAIVVAPWTIRNLDVFGRVVVISDDLGAVIGGANCAATYSGPYIGAWSFPCDHVTPGNEAQQAAREQSAGLSYARHHLGRLPAVVAARLERVWGLREPFQTNEGRSARVQQAGVLMYYLLLVPAAAGFLLLRRRRAPTWPLLAPIVCVTLVAAAGYGFLRLREPADTCLVVLAAVAFEELWRRRTGSRYNSTPPV
jgi:4-amino-4-deoxy-L-arabinose transferase-like glycosyltransferase